MAIRSHDRLLLRVIRPQLTHKAKEDLNLNLNKMKCTGNTKLLAMKRKPNYEFRFKFHNFFRILENLL
jgi:hypothetical protein